MTKEEMIAKAYANLEEKEKASDEKLAKVFSDWEKKDKETAEKIVKNFQNDMINVGKKFFGEKYFRGV